ncbi:hypothetical protein EC182770_2679 [Escherichia coli 1827-70]|nr:hypothetical protein EC182770_2679 [Escherichia coli 1827-70]EHX05546.1 hypothetical protein ECDEC11D_4218 [Escherichia coli DEC11D]EHX27236.1 hypothetical protein ECDEC12C_4500 [Escherichia coli DEC12C]
MSLSSQASLFFDRFFGLKFQYAKLDFKYIDRFLTKQSD